MNRLLAFYRGTAPDDHGRYLQEILQQDDHWLETTHNYIQWLFPNREPSQVTPDAPTLSDDVQVAFLQQAALGQQLDRSLARMLAFYGLAWDGDSIAPGANWEQRKLNWFLHDTHNNLRITRILKCLVELGQGSKARALLRTLMELRGSQEECGLGAAAFAFWEAAVGHSDRGMK